MALVPQPKNSDGCGIACIATARDISYSSVRAVFAGELWREFDRGFNATLMLRALAKLGPRYARASSSRSFRLGTIVLLEKYLPERGKKRCLHWVVRVDDGWWDPYRRVVHTKLRWRRRLALVPPR